MIPNEAQLATANALSFILAGNSTFTLRSIRTGARFTYKVRESEHKPGVYFVKVLSGPDNTADYRYLGMISNHQFRLTNKSIESNFTLETPSVNAFLWVFSKLTEGVEPQNVEIWHAGKCGRCGRKLTVPESIERGLGPECASAGF